MSDRARFVEADLYDAPRAIPEPGDFDLVFVSWGALPWLPDLAGWARIVAGFLRPGGRLYLAEGHPVASVFDDAAEAADGKPGWFAPCFQREAVVMDDPTDHAALAARLRHARTHTRTHPLGEVLGALNAAGLALEWLHEHPRLPWRMFRGPVRDADGLFTWPDRLWLPLGYSLAAREDGQAPTGGRRDSVSAATTFQHFRATRAMPVRASPAAPSRAARPSFVSAVPGRTGWR